MASAHLRGRISRLSRAGRVASRSSAIPTMFSFLLLIGGSPPSATCQIVTAERIRLPGWWPTKGDYPREAYVGPEACAACHPAQSDPKRHNAMFRTGVSPSEAEVLRESRDLRWQQGVYSYRISREPDRFMYSVGDSARTISEPIEWAVGIGKAGQTYLYLHEDTYYESRVSFYGALKGLDLTTGHRKGVPNDLEEAHGNALSPVEAKRCFACHMTAAVVENRLEPQRLIPGITCEACHGPGARHLKAMASDDRAETFVFNPAKINPGEADDFCGACHRTWWDVRLMDSAGVENVRFQPYRLQRSRCWNPDDPRAACVSCHDPHGPLERETEFYDARCLACHMERVGGPTDHARPGPACPQATSNCSTCHMPKVELPQMHTRFTDHRIRIARPGDPYTE